MDFLTLPLVKNSEIMSEYVFFYGNLLHSFFDDLIFLIKLNVFSYVIDYFQN